MSFGVLGQVGLVDDFSDGDGGYPQREAVILGGTDSAM